MNHRARIDKLENTVPPTEKPFSWAPFATVVIALIDRGDITDWPAEFDGQQLSPTVAGFDFPLRGRANQVLRQSQRLIGSFAQSTGWRSPSAAGDLGWKGYRANSVLELRWFLEHMLAADGRRNQ